MPIEAVIFDMDGILVESEAYWEQARVDFAAQRGKVWSAADQHLAMGRSTVGWAQVMQERLSLDMPLEDIIKEMKQRVMAKYDERLPERAGALACVERMASRYRVGLASGSPTELIEHVMQLTGLDKVFEVIVYGDTVPNGKPAPDIYLVALERMGVRPENALGIEDSGNGVRSLKAAGMLAIASPSEGFTLSDEVRALADVEVAHMDDITLALVERLSNQS